jgi:hypothetical protein
VPSPTTTTTTSQCCCCCCSHIRHSIPICISTPSCVVAALPLYCCSALLARRSATHPLHNSERAPVAPLSSPQDPRRRPLDSSRQPRAPSQLSSSPLAVLHAYRARGAACLCVALGTLHFSCCLLACLLSPPHRPPQLDLCAMPPRAPLQTSFSVADINNEVVCPLRNQDGSHCRKRCLGVSLAVSLYHCSHSLLSASRLAIVQCFCLL